MGFVILFSAYEGGRILNTRPNSFHLWRQTDCLSLTANYAAGRSFLEPEIHARIADEGTSGNSAGEFPLLYWSMGQLWKLIGPSEFAYRLFGILLHFLATWALFKAMQRLLENGFWAASSALLLFTSPVIVYYSPGFLTDVPAFDLAIIGWYFIVRHAQEQRRRWWALAMVCFALAALLKVTAGMSLLALAGMFALVLLLPGASAAYRRIFPSIGFGWFTIAAAVASILAWYVYADGYNDLHNGRYTFNSVWPLWDMTEEEIDRAWTFGKRILVFQVFDTSVWLALLLAFTVLAVNVRSVPWPVTVLNLTLLIGVVIYTILWFHALEGHDYYFINPMIALLVLWVSFLWWLRTHRMDLFRAQWIKVLFLVLLCYNGAYAANNMRMRYTVFEGVDPDRVLPTYHEHELPLWSADDYYHLRSALDMGPALDSLGVAKDALVIYLDDQSINGSLYLMGRKGWTNYGNDWSDPATFNTLISRGARYLIFSDPKWWNDPVVEPLLRERIGTHAWANVFDLNTSRELSDTVIIWSEHGAANISSYRVDTSGCDVKGSGLCLSRSEYPFEIKGLPLHDNEVLRSVLHVSGVSVGPSMNGIPEWKFQLGQNDGRDQVSLLEHAIRPGAFDFQWTIHRDRRSVSNTLFIWNRTGEQIRIKDLEVRVIQYRKTE